MANQKHNSPGKEKKEPKIQVRDLKSKRDVQGGTRNAGSGEKRPPPKTGEIDFMNWE